MIYRDSSIRLEVIHRVVAPVLGERFVILLGLDIYA